MNSHKLKTVIKKTPLMISVNISLNFIKLCQLQSDISPIK